MMKVAIVFVLLFASVLCRPARKPSSSSESSEEVARPGAIIRTPSFLPRAALIQDVVAAEATGEMSETPDEATDSTTDITPVDSDEDDDVDEDDDKDEADVDDDVHENEDTSDSSESGEASTPSPVTEVVPVVTEEPTVEPVTANVVIDEGRGDSSYPSEYKSIYVEDKSYQKGPSTYKSYEVLDYGKKTAPHDMSDGNEVEKTMKVYKQAMPVHELLEEDTSTPEEESQGIDASSSSQDQEVPPRQASFPESESAASNSAPSNSVSASQESQIGGVQSSEESIAMPGAANSESDESAESKEAAGPDATADIPPVITAKK